MLIPALALSLTVGMATPALAESMPDRERMWEMLQQQQKEIRALKQRLGEHGTEAGSQSERAWSDRLSLSGVVEVEASATDNANEDYSGKDSNDVTLATVELALDAAIHDLVHAQVVLLYEDNGGTPLDVDSATLTIGNTERFPVYLTAGRMGVPFGHFESNLVSDPLTLEMAETYATAVQVGFEVRGFYGSTYAFNGDAKEANSDDTIDQFGANLGFAMENDTLSLDVGVSLINSMENSGLISDTFSEDDNEDGEPDVDITNMRDHISGIGAYGVLGFSGFSLIGEYVGALDDFAVGELAFRGMGAQPAAWNVELGYTLALADKETTVALAWQGTDEALGLGLPQDRYLAALSVGIFDNTALSLEWLHDEDYDTGDDGTGGDADSGTVQVAVEF